MGASTKRVVVPARGTDPHEDALDATCVKVAETRAETYDVAKREFSRVAAAVEALEAEGWRVVKKGILPGQCTSDARHKGSPGPVRARIVFARRAPA